MKFFKLAPALLAGSSLASQWHFPQSGAEQGLCYGQMCIEFTNNGAANVDANPPEAVIAADGSVLQEKFVWTGKNDPSDIRLKVTIYGDKTIHVISQEEDVTFLFDNPEIGTCIHKAYGVKNGAMYSLESSAWKCGDWSYYTVSNFVCQKYSNGLLMRNGVKGPKIEHWARLDLANDGEMELEMTMGCNRSDPKDPSSGDLDKYVCEYDSDYYTTDWVLQDSSTVLC